MKARDIYMKYCSGESLDDNELEFGIAFFGQLSDMLFDCGAEFKLAAVESLRIRNALYSFRHARRTQ